MYGIELHAWSADHILIITDGTSILPCWETVKSKASLCELKVESVSSAEVHVLNVLLFKGYRFKHQHRRAAYVKPTGVAAPLLPTRGRCIGHGLVVRCSGPPAKFEQRAC